jgi:translation elongation factor EF-G
MKTIRFRTPVQAEGRIIKHISGAGLYGHVIIRVEPSDEAYLSFSWEVPAAVIPAEFEKSVIEGVQLIFEPDSLLPEVSCIYSRVRFIGGSFHEVDSNQMSYRTAAFEAFKEALQQAGLLLGESSIEHQKQESSAKVMGQVKEKAASAVAQFQQRAGGRLDYSESSLATVEEMLKEAARYKAQLSPNDCLALEELFGAYILDVAYRTYGGSYYWDKQNHQPVLVVGEPSYHVSLMTFGKVRGRLGGDEADQIVFFYEGFAARVRSATSGTKALYF